MLLRVLADIDDEFGPIAHPQAVFCLKDCDRARAVHRAPEIFIAAHSSALEAAKKTNSAWVIPPGNSSFELCHLLPGPEVNE